MGLCEVMLTRDTLLGSCSAVFCWVRFCCAVSRRFVLRCVTLPCVVSVFCIELLQYLLLNVKMISVIINVSFAVAKRKPEKMQACMGLEPLT